MILSWDKPEKIMPVESWRNISADGAPPGVYTPNMSIEDAKKWKAKYIGGEYPRVEIRKSTDNGTQILIVVAKNEFPNQSARLHGKNIRVSQNGVAFFSFEEMEFFQKAIMEAKAVLEIKI